MASSFIPLLFFSLSLLHQLFPCNASIHRRSLDESQIVKNVHPVTYFEVTKPIKLPKTSPCSQHILHHDFGNTLAKPPVLANYSPPLNCPSRSFAKIVLEFQATCKGRQFDRIFGIWLGGVELLRSCTAEPTKDGIVWTVKKDITKYYSLLMTYQTLAVYMGNIVDSTYTGVYHVDISIHFYPAKEHSNVPTLPNSDKLVVHHYDSKADLILPISRNLPLNDGLWFEIQNSTDVHSKEFNIPQNAYRAVLEVYVSPHENDEFWYTNYVNEYIVANNLTDVPGNGPFREVIVSLDGNVVGAVWPFTVVYTGGINPLLWRPITAVRSFDLPSYDIELTPSLGTLLDGKAHELSFRVENALNVWYIDANLHIWLDKHSVKTEGKLSKMKNTLTPSTRILSNFTGLNGTFLTKSSRFITSTGWVRSSYGKITTKSTQEFMYTNFMVLRNDGNSQIVKQTINCKDNVIAKTASSYVHSIKTLKSFPFYLYSENMDQGNETSTTITNLTVGFAEKKVKTSDHGSSVISSLNNKQKGQASMVIKGHLLVSGVGSTQQEYKYDSSRDCYHRSISSSNYTVSYDKESNKCSRRKLNEQQMVG